MAEGHLHIKIETIFLETFWSIEAKHPPIRAMIIFFFFFFFFFFVILNIFSEM